DRYACETIALCLERHGHQIIRAHTGASAIAAITQCAPHLVMTEIMLPMRSGFDILGAVKGLGLLADVPVLFITANSSEREIERALAAGVVDYIVKPFHPRELALRANLALGRRAADRAPAGNATPGSGHRVRQVISA
ncbi:MAG TPA: response regulator, partial [Erythrobacter sp.]|nr:response regulator [Erythrobacter sp.]